MGSGGILFNLEKEFKEYIVNDLDRNIVRIYKSFKEIDYEYYSSKIEYVKNEFGYFKETKGVVDKETAKENYYRFRNWFNENHWNKDTIDEGIYCYILANSCINSMLRFGPNGMNQSFGNRAYLMDALNFSNISKILKKTTIFNLDYKEIIKLYPDACYFMDPPYYSKAAAYTPFSEDDLKEFLLLIKDKKYVYTDILNEFNDCSNKIIYRDMVSTSPLKNSEKSGNIECIFSSININNNNDIDTDEW